MIEVIGPEFVPLCDVSSVFDERFGVARGDFLQIHPTEAEHREALIHHRREIFGRVCLAAMAVRLMAAPQTVYLIDLGRPSSPGLAEGVLFVFEDFATFNRELFSVWRTILDEGFTDSSDEAFR